MDRQGINREELVRLARARLPISNFDKSKLSKDGFAVLITDREVTLPDGSLVENGLLFRNDFHLNKMASADLFVPCGGRPEAIHLNNVEQVDTTWKIIVEGANLFITQGARLVLESKGIMVIKDASANKGGVISSSLEVLAGLALPDALYRQHMHVPDMSNPPDFYRTYVQQIQTRIREACRMEFEVRLCSVSMFPVNMLFFLYVCINIWHSISLSHSHCDLTLVLFLSLTRSPFIFSPRTCRPSKKNTNGPVSRGVRSQTSWADGSKNSTTPCSARSCGKMQRSDAWSLPKVPSQACCASAKWSRQAASL